MVAEPLPSPISKLPEVGSGVHYPLPADTDYIPGIVFDADKFGPGVGGWQTVKIPFSQLGGGGPGGGLEDAYVTISDGANIATAVGAGVFKLRSADNKLSILVTNNQAVHGDNALLTINQANIDHDALFNFVASEHAAHPTVSTDEAIARYNGTAGALQNSGITINDAGKLISANAAFSAGGFDATFSNAGFDVVFGWDNSAGTYKSLLLADILTEAAPATGDFVLVYGAEGDLRKVNWSGLPGAAGGTQAFGTIQVSGQSDVVADAAPDILTLIAGANITITTNAATDAITIAATGGVTDGDKGDITVSSGGVTWLIDNNAVTFVKMQDIATSRFIGRITAASGDPEELTGTQATTLLDTFTSALKGLVPASGGGTANFLRADGVFAAPPGGGGGLADAYAAMTDGTVTSNASASDTFKLRSADNKLTITVTNNDATHGDNALFTINEANFSAGNLGGGAALTKTDDTNVTLTLGGTPATALLKATSITVGWTGTLAAGRLNANVVQAVANDTNVTGSISAQTLTLGWTGTLAVARGGLGVGTVTGLLQGNGTGAVTAIANSSTVGQVLRVTGVNAYAWGALDLADTDAITGDLPFANLAQGAALSVLGVAGNAAADHASIAAGTDGHVLRRSGTAIGFGTVVTVGIADDAVTFPKMQNIATDRLLGRDTAASGDVEEIAVTGGIVFNGSGSLTLDADLTALAGLAATGIAVRSAADTWVQRSIAGVSGNIAVTNGDGVAGNPTIDVGADVLLRDVTATITVGYTVTPNNLGNMTSFTVNPALGNYQFGTNNAAITITAPTSDCAVDILVTNHATTAGAITLSGFTAPAGGGGDTYATTGNNRYLLNIRRINGVSTYLWKALQ